MNRKTFIRIGCVSCTSIGLLSTLLESCTAVRYTSGEMAENGLYVDTKEFSAGERKREYIIVRNEDLQYPICVYHIKDNQYSALLLQCTHQGAELQVAGGQLTCPAHGSEFDKEGKVAQGPATANLRSFPVTISGDKLFIDLRKQAG